MSNMGMGSNNLPISVSLIIRGDTFDPSIVSKKLGLTPSRCQRKGENRITSNNKQIIASISLWKLSSGSSSRVISDHISELLSKIGEINIGSIIKEIDGIQEAYIDVFIAEITGEDGGGTSEFSINKDDMAMLGSLGLPVRFTVAHVNK